MKIVPIPRNEPASFDARFKTVWATQADTFSNEAFLKTLESLIRYPERTSSTIMRADILSDVAVNENDTTCCMSAASEVKQWSIRRSIRRKLLPRNPKLDDAMIQNCFILHHVHEDETSLVIYEPENPEHIPYYHPSLAAVAFHYTTKWLTISYIPLILPEEIDRPLQLCSEHAKNRLSRTLLHLTTIVAKHSLGHMNDYIKRVQHDQLVPKDEWQDLYTSLKGDFATAYVENWVEGTDPRKHVFEDLGIAAFIIRLISQGQTPQDAAVALEFVDVGCGNGLLVDILLRNGFQGYGFDARHRKSWVTYAQHTQDRLLERILYPSILLDRAAFEVDEEPLSPDTTPHDQSDRVLLHNGLFRASQFLIGNHADELTPYIPILAAIASVQDGTTHGQEYADTSGFMIIPCCMHTFSGEKHKALDTKGGRYASYIQWLVQICEALGWIVEKEALRIPSTRNWAIICRRRRLIELDVSAVGVHESNHTAESVGMGVISSREKLLGLCRDIVRRNGGMTGFLVRAKTLVSKKPRAH